MSLFLLENTIIYINIRNWIKIGFIYDKKTAEKFSAETDKKSH